MVQNVAAVYKVPSVFCVQQYDYGGLLRSVPTPGTFPPESIKIIASGIAVYYPKIQSIGKEIAM